MKKILLSLVMFHAVLQSSSLEQLYDSSFLKKTAEVQRLLQKHHFKKICFYTADNIKLCGLFLDQSKHLKEPIKGTIIFDTGFYPGNKEGMATLYALLADQPYNFLFFDARGHNESSGTLINYQTLKQYGSQDYLDVVAAINFVQQYGKDNNICTHVILHGICAGAYHNVKAANRCPCKNSIKGLVFDSGWNKVEEIAEPALHSEVNKLFKNSYFSFLAKPLNALISYFYNLCFRPQHSKIDSLDNDISNLECPVFFIHSKLDPYAPIQPAQQLATKAKNKQTWWVETDGHAMAHLHHPKEYKKRLQQFCLDNFKA